MIQISYWDPNLELCTSRECEKYANIFAISKLFLTLNVIQVYGIPNNLFNLYSI